MLLVQDKIGGRVIGSWHSIRHLTGYWLLVQDKTTDRLLVNGTG